MSKLYDIVNKTINAGSMLEAEQILFGSDGIVINSKEYYENIISNFVKKKETVIRKIVDSNGKTQLVFDLNNYNDMWNILFIYNYYISYLDNRIADLNHQINDCKRVKDDLAAQMRELKQNDPRYNEISKQWQDKETERNNLDKLKSYFIQLKNNSLRANAVQLENIERIDEIQLKQYLDKLKEAINCIQKIRDSLEHRNNNFNFDNNILNINNKLGKFEILIPIKYLDGFNKGRIIVNDEDQVIVERTNEMAYPLLESLDFDIKKVESFFYNVEPSYLEFILEKVNYDVNELYKLSSYIFQYKKETKIFLNKGFDLFDITKLSYGAFKYVDNTIKLKKAGIDITKLSSGAFKYVDNTIKLKKAGIDITKLPDSAFEYADNAIKLKEAGIDVTKLSYGVFEYADNAIKLKEESIDITELSDCAFEYVDNTIKLKEAGIVVTKLSYGAFKYVDNAIKLKKAGIDITKLLDGAFKYVDNTIKLKEAGIDVTKFSVFAFEYMDKKIKRDGIDITRLLEGAFKYVDNAIKLKEAGIDITKLPGFAFEYVDNTIKLKEAGIDVTKLSDGAFEYVDNAIKLKEAGIDITKLPGFAFEYVDNTIKLKEAGIDVIRFPLVFAFEYMDNIIKLKEAGIDVTKLPGFAFEYVDNTIKLKEAGIVVTKLPFFAFKYVDNIRKIIDKVGYELLDMIPVEFFTCNIDLLDEMFKKYNLNISRSVFGIKNPKIIAALIYANSVLSNYNDKTISTIDMDIKPYSIICDTYIDNYKYRNNIEENIGREYNSSEFVEQFKLFDDDSLDRSTDDIKKIILNKFRNACAHFRFKLVKDKDGNIIEDKVYIYDEDNNGINNFNLIIDLNEFVRIVREAEIHIGMQKNNVEELIRKSR